MIDKKNRKYHGEKVDNNMLKDSIKIAKSKKEKLVYGNRYKKKVFKRMKFGLLLTILLILIVLAFVWLFIKSQKQAWFQIGLTFLFTVSTICFYYFFINLIYFLVTHFQCIYYKKSYTQVKKRKAQRYRMKKKDLNFIVQKDWLNNVEQIVGYLSKKIGPKLLKKDIFNDYFKISSKYSFERRRLLINEFDKKMSFDEVALIVEELEYVSFFEKTYINFFTIIAGVVALISSSKFIFQLLINASKLESVSNDNSLNYYWKVFIALSQNNSFIIITFFLIMLIVVEFFVLCVFNGWDMMRKRTKLLIILKATIRKKEFSQHTD